jgi:hypothetical protein
LPGPIDEGDQITYSLSVSESGEWWARLQAGVTVRPGENGVQAAERAAGFVNNLLKSHVDELRKSRP